MGVFRRMGKIIKPLVDIPRWMDAKRIADGADIIGGMAKSIFKPAQAKQKEDFSTAVERLKLTEKELERRYREFTRLFRFFFVTFLLVGAYATYLWFASSWHAAVLGTVVTGIPLVLAYRFHFWRFQLIQRRLGCNFKEWLRVGVLGKKP